MATSIVKVRLAIASAAWARNDLVGGTPEEFRRQQVGPALQKHIDTLRALDFNVTRFCNDDMRRRDEITRCSQVIARWEAAQ